MANSLNGLTTEQSLNEMLKVSESQVADLDKESIVCYMSQKFSENADEFSAMAIEDLRRKMSFVLTCMGYTFLFDSPMR